ncbi:MAG: GNAT family N-acetyltransferase [Chloroflexi bacterium]|nr:GNAT family N-acetyltransferase [Chloroflexota bacterium]MCY4246476.1 GNAT family N-acetyltransferase [Chloroflexota bacterium]
MIQAQAYRDSGDLFRAQAALMRWVRERGLGYYIHKGDVGHRLCNGGYKFAPCEIFFSWLHGDELAAFAILLPNWEIFDLQVAPAWLYSDLHSGAMRFCEGKMLELAQRHKLTMKKLLVEVGETDRAYADFVVQRGYTYSKPCISLARHDLAELPDKPLPAGFRFHDADAADAANLADAHNHSFTPKWDAEAYAAVFQAPHMEREIVVIAPDGRFAAFVNVWHDSVNRSLLFEPVGTHSDFRRRGLASALMSYAMRRMQSEWGIECAYVCHQPLAMNAASGPLYASLGFVKLHDFAEYAKPMS